MMAELKSAWVFDGQLLSTPYSNVQYRSSGWNIPSRDGENLKNSNTDGTAWQPYKPFDEKRVPLAMWLTGYTTNPEVTPTQALDERIERLSLLLGRSGSLYRLERRHFMDGAVNRVVNPRFRGGIVARSTGITKLPSGNYTAPKNGYIGFELPVGSTTVLNLNNVQYYYNNIRKKVTGWYYLEAGQKSVSSLPSGGVAYWYNPDAANHVRVANLFPLPKAIDQWHKVNWTGGNIIARSADGTGQLVAVTPAGGKYTYDPIPFDAIEPKEQILNFYVQGTVAPVYVTEVKYPIYSESLSFEDIPESLFGDVIFADSTYSTINVPVGNVTLVPTQRGWVLPAQGTSVTYDTYGQVPNTTRWERFYGSGMVKWQGLPPKMQATPLAEGETVYTTDGFFYDADFRDPGQTVRVTITNDKDYIVSPTLITHMGVYTHTKPMEFAPDYFDGDVFNATWLGSPHNSISLMHSSRWIDVECPTGGVDFVSQAGGTRATCDFELTAPGVYWRDNVDIFQQTSWNQLPSQSGKFHDWNLTQFSGGSGPLGGILLDITAWCPRSGWDVELDIHDVATQRTVTVKIPVNQTWRLDANKFLFYQISPQLAMDRYASMERVHRSFGGDLVTIHPVVGTGMPILQFRTPVYASDTINFEAKLSAHRRYLNA